MVEVALNFRKQKMPGMERRNESAAEKAAWPLLFITVVLQVFMGLSAVAYVFMGVPKPFSLLGGSIVALTGGLQAIAAVVAFVLALRRDLRGATLAAAGSIMAGWLSTLPSVAEQGLDFYGDGKLTPFYFNILPLIAIAAALLAWRNPHPVAAALVVSSLTAVGILFVIVFGIIIAVHGF